MLRSRSNRQQRPSESTDERQGGRYDYGGYPPASGEAPSPMAGIASGADDGDYNYGGYGSNSKNNHGYYHTPQQKKGRQSSSSWMGGPRNLFGFGGGGGDHKKDDNQRDVWDRQQMGSTFKGPKNGNNASGIMFILLSVAFILTISMGGATLHYRKSNDRLSHELMVVNRRIKTKGGGRMNRFNVGADEEQEVGADNGVDENYNDSNSNIPQDLIDLRTSKSQLQAESNKWTTRKTQLENDILALQTQIDHLEKDELATYNSQIQSLQSNIQKEVEAGKNYKSQFIAAHSKKSSSHDDDKKVITSGETRGSGDEGIIPGGPGHASLQKREIEKMESLDDYEEYVQRREDALWDKIDLLLDRFADTYRREAMEWFGPGPHKVELHIKYPKYTEDKEPKDWPQVRGVLTLEMAPLGVMPIAVNLFLQQVHHKLWNGCSFIINAYHILQAGPHRLKPGGKSGYDSNLKALLGRFERARLDKMPFQEYHADYPHAPFTVGYAGRPGGPDFYINKIDNSINHGPGGQSHHDLHEEADPCFAKLVGGMDVIGDLNKIPVDYDKGSLLLHPVMIVDSKVIAATEEEMEESKKKAAAAAGSESRSEEEEENEQQIASPAARVE